MISDEMTKLHLLLAYEISKLYVESCTTSSTISEVTEIPISTVKRCLTTIKKRKEEYLNLLPKLATEKELDALQAKVDEEIEVNKINNKWNKIPTNLDLYKERVDNIKELYRRGNLSVSSETKSKITNLRMNGFSMRNIARETGVSLGTIHKIIKSDDASKQIK